MRLFFFFNKNDHGTGAPADSTAGLQLQPPVRVTRGARDPGTPEPHLPGGPDAVGARWGQRSPRAGSSSGDSRCSEAQQRRLKEGSRYATRARHSSPRLKIQHRSSALGTKSPGLGASDLADQSAPRVSSAASPGSGVRGQGTGAGRPPECRAPTPWVGQDGFCARAAESRVGLRLAGSPGSAATWDRALPSGLHG